MQIHSHVGTHAKEFALGAGGSALLGASLGVIRVKLDNPNAELDGGKVFAVVVGLTALGAAIGALIGQSKPKYETEFEESAFKVGSISIAPARKGLGIALTF